VEGGVVRVVVRFRRGGDRSHEDTSSIEDFVTGF